MIQCNVTKGKKEKKNHLEEEDLELFFDFTLP